MAKARRRRKAWIRFAGLDERDRLVLDSATDSAINHQHSLLQIPLEVDARMQACVGELVEVYHQTRDRVLASEKTIRGHDRINLQHVVEDGIFWEARRLAEAPTQAAGQKSMERVGSYMELSDKLLGPRSDKWAWVEHLLPSRRAA
jgi:hypothetical protein